MKEQLHDLVSRADGVAHGLNLAREYLQARMLLALQDTGAMIPLAFQGGTALRFLYGLPRFSEDLDFALERPDRGFDLKRASERVTAYLNREGYETVARPSAGPPERAVQSVMVSFPGLLREVGLSDNPDRRLRIRIEIDTRPPAGAVLETTVVRRHALLNLQHHDRASLLAGKLHALLQRRWTKGRDLFDLFWYLSDPTWPGPNTVLLNNALAQTGWDDPVVDRRNWKQVLYERVTTLDWTAAERDVAPFLEPGPETAVFGRETLLKMLEQ